MTGNEDAGVENAWPLAMLAIDLLAAYPEGLGGLSLCARDGPVRDQALEVLGRLSRPLTRIHPAMTHEALFGGLDLAATLSAGEVVETAGVLNSGAIPALTMAERTPPDLAAKLGAWVDETDGPIVVLDEGAEPGESVPPVIKERLAFHVSLDGIGRLEAVPPPKRAMPAPENVRKVKVPVAAIGMITKLAARLGIDSLRAPRLAVNAARALAALDQRDKVQDSDIETAALLVLAPRATRIPEPPPEPETEQPEAEDQPQSKGKSQEQMAEEDMLVEAIRPQLPKDLLEILAARKNRSAKGTGAGQKRRSNRRGRPLPARPGRLGSGARIDLVATLRSAAPWQGMRARGTGPIKVHPGDIRLRRYEEKSDRLVIFAVDASGSSAMARLAEAKGAVELLLSEAYASRDHVALIAFRGHEADLILPPTRSLVQTKRRLAALPGGGGTPLAAGLRSAGELALKTRAQGLTPTLALLTDGRANIALDGSANREAARGDTQAMARWLRSEAVPALVFDTGTRPDRGLQALAGEMEASYLPLPRADAHALGRALRDGLDA